MYIFVHRRCVLMCRYVEFPCSRGGKRDHGDKKDEWMWVGVVSSGREEMMLIWMVRTLIVVLFLFLFLDDRVKVMLIALCVGL